MQLTGAGRSCDHLVNEHVRDSATSTDDPARKEHLSGESTRDRIATLHKNLPICRELYIIYIIERGLRVITACELAGRDDRPAERRCATICRSS